MAADGWELCWVTGDPAPGGGGLMLTWKRAKAP